MLNSRQINIDSTIGKMPLSELFKKFAQHNALTTLKAVTDLTVKELIKLPGFQVHYLTELISLLEKHGLAGLIKHEP